MDNVDSLIAAVLGANVVFGVTDFWEPFYNPATKASLLLVNQSMRYVMGAYITAS